MKSQDEMAVTEAPNIFTKGIHDGAGNIPIPHKHSAMEVSHSQAQETIAYPFTAYFINMEFKFATDHGSLSGNTESMFLRGLGSSLHQALYKASHYTTLGNL